MQSYPDFEAIIVDDCSIPEKAAQLAIDHFKDDRLKCIRLPEHSERVIARKTGWAASSGQFVCNLDSDDEYASHYLETVYQAICDYPGKMCFNFGAVVHHRSKAADGTIRYTGTSLRPTFKPAWLGDRHEEFRSGKIGTGSFVFYREVLDGIVSLPDASNPFKFHELAVDVHNLYPFPGQPLGNNWGDDYLLYYRITRIFQSVPLEICLYIQHVRVS
jgi:glycosyltransferase involved in cell wall biosynthesis